MPGSNRVLLKSGVLEGTEKRDLQELLERLEHRNRWHIEKPIEVGKRAVFLARKSSDSTSIGMAHFYLANVYRNASDYSNAMENFVVSLLVFDELEDDLMRARCYYSMGHIQSHVDNMEDAFDYINYSILYADKVENKDRYLKANVELGMMHMRVNQLDDAARCFNLVESLFSGEKHDSIILAGMYNGMAAVALKQKKYASCEKISLKSLDLVLQLGDIKAEAVIKSNLGELLLLQGRYEDAIEFLHSSIELGKEINYHVSSLDGHKLLMKIYEKTGEFDLAATHKSKVVELENQLGLE